MSDNVAIIYVLIWSKFTYVYKGQGKQESCLNSSPCWQAARMVEGVPSKAKLGIGEKKKKRRDIQFWNETREQKIYNLRWALAGSIHARSAAATATATRVRDRLIVQKKEKRTTINLQMARDSLLLFPESEKGDGARGCSCHARSLRLKPHVNVKEGNERVSK